MKNFFRILMAAAVLLTASCAKEDISSSIVGGGEVEMTFTVDLPELGTRANTYGNGANATLLRYFVFDAANGAELEALRGTATRTSGNFTFTLPLLKGMKYNIALWADKNVGTAEAPVGFYAFDGKVVTVNYVDANDNDRDAFFHYEPNFDPTNPRTTTFTLYRPFAQLNAAVVNSDIDAVTNNGVTLTTSTVEVTTYTQFNLATGDVVESSKTVVNTFAATDMPYEASETLKSGYTYLSMNYLLAPKDGMLSDVTFTFNNNKGVDFGATYTNVPLKQNFRTNILGKLLTASTEFTVEIEDAFDEPAIEVWNGESVAKPEYDENTKTYTVSNAAEFAWISALTNGTLPASSRTEYADAEKIDNHTILLDGDLDFGGKTLAPINNVNGLTFDGQGHTIYNISYGMGENYSTMFEIASNTVVKDVNFEGVAVNATGTGRGATLIGYYTGGTVENVHVKDVVVKGFQKLSGLVAYVTQDGGVDVTIKDCSVEDITIAASDAGKVYQAGGLVGYISSPIEADLTFENCEVKGNIAINDTPELEGDDCFGFYSGGFIGSISQKSGVDEGITININNCKVGTVTATPALSVSPRGHELFADCSNGSIAGRIANNIYIDGNKYVCNCVTTNEELVNAANTAQAGDTIFISNDITLTDNVTLPAGVILNGNGKQINGTIIAGGDLTIKGHTKVTGFSASYYDRTITIGEGACLEVTGTGRVSLAYGNVFNITGTITDAKSADKTSIQPSLIVPGGVSITGGNDAVLNIKDAYVEIGSTTSKNNAANGTFTINIENSIADFTNQLTFSEPTSGYNPTFNINVKNSELTTATKLILAAPNCNMVVDNSTINVATYFRNSGNVELKNGSTLTGSTIQFGENGGHDGETVVDNSTFTINANSPGHAYDGRGTGSITAKNGATVNVEYYKDLTINVDTTSTFTGTEVL